MKPVDKNGTPEVKKEVSFRPLDASHATRQPRQAPKSREGEDSGVSSKDGWRESSMLALLQFMLHRQHFAAVVNRVADVDSLTHWIFGPKVSTVQRVHRNICYFRCLVNFQYTT